MERVGHCREGQRPRFLLAASAPFVPSAMARGQAAPAAAALAAVVVKSGLEVWI